MRKPIYFYILVCFVSMGIGQRRFESALQAQEVVADTIYLGQGYDTETFQRREDCVLGLEHVEYQPQASWTFQALESWDRVRRDLGYKDEAEFAFAFATGQPKAMFARQLQDTELSASFMISADYLRATHFYDNVQVKPGLLRQALASVSGLRDFRRRCGNHYTDQIDVGGRLRVLLKFRFSSVHAKSLFGLRTERSGDTAAPILIVDHMSQAERKSSTVEISLHQEGGDASHLGADIKQGSSLECPLSTWERCRQVVADLIHYSLAVLPVDVMDGSTRTIAHSTRYHEDLELPRLSAQGEALMKANALELERQDFDMQKVQIILRSRDAYSIDDRKHELEAIYGALRRNLLKLKANIVRCADFSDDGNHCLEPAALSLEAYDPERIGPGSSLVEGPSLGNSKGEEFTRMCNNFMLGARGYNGKIVDKLLVNCDDGQVLPSVGSSTNRNNYDKSCPAGRVVTGIRGGRSADQHPGSLAFVCSPIKALRAKQAIGPLYEISILGKDRKFSWDCPSGYAAVGLKGRESDYLDSLRLVCASY